MQVNGPSHLHGPHGINPPHITNRGQAGHSTSATGADRVEISPAAEAAIQAADEGDIRQGLVDSIRAQIAAGTYETPAKLDGAVERLLDQIG